MKKYNIEVYKLKELSENAQIKANKEFKRLIPFDLKPLMAKLETDYKQELLKNGFKDFETFVKLSLLRQDDIFKENSQYVLNLFYFNIARKKEFKYKNYTLIRPSSNLIILKENNKKVVYTDYNLKDKLYLKADEIYTLLYKINSKYSKIAKELFKKEYYKQLNKAVFFKNGNLFNKSML